MGWDTADQALDGDWIKLADATADEPFELLFTSDPEVETKEFRGKPHTQIIFSVKTRQGDAKKIGLSRKAYREFKASIVDKVGHDKVPKTPVRCWRVGASFDTEYVFEVMSKGKQEDTPPPPEPDDNAWANADADSDLPF